MKKTTILLISLVIFTITLYATTHTVGTDGQQDFTTIQSAILVAEDGDSIIVYPGTYYENVDFLQKSLFLGSLYSTTQDRTYISQTIIDGMRQGPTVEVVNCEDVTIDGFTIQNGFFRYELTWMIYPIFRTSVPPGGGIFVNISTNVIISNNIITNNVSISGGGVCIVSASTLLQGNQIYRNMASHSGGGLFIMMPEENTVLLDNVNVNSIYLNASSHSNDIYIGASSAQPEIHLALATFAESSPHIHNQLSGTAYIITEGYVEEAEGNLYVSSDGDDNNSGLSPAEPLRTITRAVLKAQSSLYPINVSDGVYSLETGELFPIQLKPLISIEGESKENTIIDAGNLFTTVMGASTINPSLPNDISIKNLTFLHDIIAGMDGQSYVLDFELNFEGSYRLDNISINTETERSNSFGGIRLEGCGWAELKNIEIYRIDDSLEAFFPVCYDDDERSRWAISLTYHTFFMEHILIDGGNHGIWLYRDSNPEKHQGLFPISNMSNILVKNLSDNTIHTRAYNSLYIPGTSFVTNPTDQPPSHIQMINCTFFNNHGRAGMFFVGSHTKFDMYNNIIHACEPDTIRLDCWVNTPSYSIVSHNLFDDMESIFVFNDPNYWTISYDNNIDGDPLFIGEGPFPEALTEDSPAINTGTLAIPAYFPPQVDLAGNLRVGNMGDWLIDIGAYEYQWANSDDDEVISASVTTLMGNYPNPFNPETTIRFALGSDGFVSIDVYNIRGQKVRTLLNGVYSGGEHRVVWNGVSDDGRNVGSGVYFYRMSAGGYVGVKKMLLLK